MNAVPQKGRARTSASSAALIWVAMLLTASASIAQPVPQPGAQTARPILTPAAPPAASPQTSKAAAQAATVASETDTSSYIIGANDSLQITVWQEPSLSGTFPVRPDGMISLVLVGDIAAAGVTPMHLAHDITLKLKKYVQDPIVAVVVTAVNSQRIYLVGEIQHAGPIVLSPGMTPLQAIAEAGGLSPYTNGKHIYILRGPQGQQKKIPFNYRLALKGDNRQDVPLLPGDTIVVP